MFPRKAAILFNKVSDDPSKDEADVTRQAGAVKGALERLGYSVVETAAGENFYSDVRELANLKPEFVFNLVEAVGGKNSLNYLAPAVLESYGLKYAGCSAEALLTTTDKLIAKRILKSSGLPTPRWATASDTREYREGRAYIIKDVTEDGSVGISEASVVKPENAEALREMLSAGNLFAEEFIEGREINVSLLGKKDFPRVLVPCEINFDGFEKLGRIKIYDYSAKWNEGSPEYAAVKPTTEFETRDSKLLAKLIETSIDCWRLFKLKGYARIDFRIDGRGKIYVLEINGNPCVTPGDSSFMRSAEASGMTFEEIVREIVEAI
jgi:D-alanine-D-alanine ligase and related ATP-grasp enzymes